MRNKKNDELKRRLEHELPYPKLTVQADLKFDEILSMLPDKQESSLKSETYADVRYERGETLSDDVEVLRDMEYPEPEFKRPSRTKRIVQIFASAAAACLVLVVLLKLTTLQVPDVPPVGEGDSQATESNLPVYHFPEDKADYTAEITSASQQGCYLFMTVRLEFEPDAVPDTEQLFTGSVLRQDSQNDITVTVDGREAVLYRDVVFQRSLFERNAFDGIVIAVLPDGSGDNVNVSINTLYGVDAETHLAFDEPEIKLTETVTCSSAVEDDPYGDRATSKQGAFLLDYYLEDGNFYCEFGHLFPVNYVNNRVMAVAEGSYGSVTLEERGLPGMSADEFDTGDYPLVARCGFGPVPEGTEKVTVTIYHQFEPGKKYLYMNGERITNPVIVKAEIDVTDLEQTSFGSPDLSRVSYDDTVLAVSYPDYALAMKAGARYHGHVLTLEWEKLMQEATGTMLYLNVYSDVDMDLPLAAEVYLEGSLIEILPLYRTAESEVIEDGYNNGDFARVETDHSTWILYSEWDNRFRRGYALSIDLTKGNDALRESYPDIEALREAGFTVILRNLATREALASTDGLAAEDKIENHLDIIGTQEELLLERSFVEPFDFSEGFPESYEIPEAALPANSKTDSAADDLSTALDDLRNNISSMPAD